LLPYRRHAACDGTLHKHPNKLAGCAPSTGRYSLTNHHSFALPQPGVVSKWLAVHLTGRDTLAGARSLSLARPNDGVSEPFDHSYCSSGDGRLPSPTGSNKHSEREICPRPAVALLGSLRLLLLQPASCFILPPLPRVPLSKRPIRLSTGVASFPQIAGSRKSNHARNHP
jgi:hypothetical protein